MTLKKVYTLLKGRVHRCVAAGLGTAKPCQRAAGAAAARRRRIRCIVVAPVGTKENRLDFFWKWRGVVVRRPGKLLVQVTHFYCFFFLSTVQTYAWSALTYGFILSRSLWLQTRLREDRNDSVNAVRQKDRHLSAGLENCCMHVVNIACIWLSGLSGLTWPLGASDSWISGAKGSREKNIPGLSPLHCNYRADIKQLYLFTKKKMQKKKLSCRRFGRVLGRENSEGPSITWRRWRNRLARPSAGWQSRTIFQGSSKPPSAIYPAERRICKPAERP